MAEQLGIDDLRPGMVILQIVEQNGPVKIRKSGLVTSEAMVQGLKEMGVLSVQIDPAQTVELEAETRSTAVPHSPTKALLMQGAGNRADTNLSDQFHRSLFLPSVQALPASWQYYGRKLLTASLVLIGGAGLGWTAATFENWAPAFQQEPGVQIASQTQPALQPAKASDGQMASERPSQGQQEPAKPGQDNQTAQEPVRPAPEPEGELVSATPERPPVDISPELLEKFQQAVSELDSDAPPEPKAEPQPTRDVVRVDQLPAWALAELPSLSFSAHMYASEPADRWVRVNDMELGEGDWITDSLRVVRIESQHVILAYKGQEFSMRALTDW